MNKPSIPAVLEVSGKIKSSFNKNASKRKVDCSSPTLKSAKCRATSNGMLAMGDGMTATGNGTIAAAVLTTPSWFTPCLAPCYLLDSTVPLCPSPSDNHANFIWGVCGNANQPGHCTGMPIMESWFFSQSTSASLERT
jgi:hypothetical protein